MLAAVEFEAFEALCGVVQGAGGGCQGERGMGGQVRG